MLASPTSAPVGSGCIPSTAVLPAPRPLPAPSSPKLPPVGSPDPLAAPCPATSTPTCPSLSTPWQGERLEPCSPQPTRGTKLCVSSRYHLLP